MEHLTLLAGGLHGVGVGVCHIIFQIIEFALLVAINNLFGRQYGLCLGVPVDHAQAAIDKSFLIKVYKNLKHTLAARLVHGEGCAVPVAAGAQAAQLFENDAAVLFCPVPGIFQELLAGEVALPYALLGEAVNHLGLGGDAGVVGAGHPAGVLAVDACLAHKYILNGIVEHVTHVQHTRHVWRRNDYGVRLAPVGPGAKQLVSQPIFIPFAFHFGRIVLTC